MTDIIGVMRTPCPTWSRRAWCVYIPVNPFVQRFRIVVFAPTQPPYFRTLPFYPGVPFPPLARPDSISPTGFCQNAKNLQRLRSFGMLISDLFISFTSERFRFVHRPPTTTEKLTNIYPVLSLLSVFLLYTKSMKVRGIFLTNDTASCGIIAFYQLWQHTDKRKQQVLKRFSPTGRRNITFRAT